VVRLLLKSQIEGAPAQALLRTCTALFKQLEAVFKVGIYVYVHVNVFIFLFMLHGTLQAAG